MLIFGKSSKLSLATGQTAGSIMDADADANRARPWGGITHVFVITRDAVSDLGPIEAKGGFIDGRGRKFWLRDLGTSTLHQGQGVGKFWLPVPEP